MIRNKICSPDDFKLWRFNCILCENMFSTTKSPTGPTNDVLVRQLVSRIKFLMYFNYIINKYISIIF